MHYYFRLILECAHCGLYTNTNSCRVAMMSLVQRQLSAVRFYDVNCRGSFNPDEDLEILTASYNMLAFRAMLQSVLKKGFKDF